MTTPLAGVREHRPELDGKDMRCRTCGQLLRSLRYGIWLIWISLQSGQVCRAGWRTREGTMSTTTDPDDPRLGHGSDTEPRPQQEAYLVLSEEERAKGFARPVRRSYRHAGIAGPQYPLCDLTSEDAERYAASGYVKYEEYPQGESGVLGRFWTQAQLDSAGNGCGTVTTMGRALAETYAAKPAFYGSTYCCGCQRHRPVGAHGEFTWVAPDGSDTTERVGT